MKRRCLGEFVFLPETDARAQGAGREGRSSAGLERRSKPGLINGEGPLSRTSGPQHSSSEVYAVHFIP